MTRGRQVAFVVLAMVSGALLDGSEAAATHARLTPRDPSLQRRGDLVLRDGRPFTGTIVQSGPSEPTAEVPYVDGKRHGRVVARYPGGALAYEKTFFAGEREGTHRGFWPNGRLQFEYHYVHDLFDGEQVAYHENGSRAELRHLVAGHEEGRQSTWDAEGRIASNYTFKGGKRYGIVGRSDCVSVHEK